jgi:hypothetical protein
LFSQSESCLRAAAKALIPPNYRCFSCSFPRFASLPQRRYFDQRSGVVPMPGTEVMTMMLLMLTLLTAWLVVGCGIAWAIGNSSDLGKPSEES